MAKCYECGREIIETELYCSDCIEKVKEKMKESVKNDKNNKKGNK